MQPIETKSSNLPRSPPHVGGGVSNRQQDRLWHYAFATGSPLEESGLQTETTTSDPLLSGEAWKRNIFWAGFCYWLHLLLDMHTYFFDRIYTSRFTSFPGLGVGLPVARTYAAYFQGSLDGAFIRPLHTITHLFVS